MKFISLLILTFLLSSCSQPSIHATNTDKNILNLEKSKNTWLKYKIHSNNSYTYFTNFSSWSGFGYETEIKVKNGIFIKRKYTSWNTTTETSWEEIKENLGKNKEGSKLKLIDDLYKECKNILQTKNKLTNNIYLGFDNNGLLSHCLYSAKNCADDCSNGIQIKEINFLK